MQPPKKHRGIFTRIRYLNGHGIHSPFVYSLVRLLFGGDSREGGAKSGDGMGGAKGGGKKSGELYGALRREGLKSRTSQRIQNFYTFCGYDGFSIGYNPDVPLCVILPRGEFRPEIIHDAPRTTFVIAAPYSDKRRIGACFEIAAAGERLTVDARRFFIIFGHDRLPRQHFKI